MSKFRASSPVSCVARRIRARLTNQLKSSPHVLDFRQLFDPRLEQGHAFSSTGASVCEWIFLRHARDYNSVSSCTLISMSASPQATFSRPHLIFVLAGQSNMAGRGALDQALPQNPRILLLSGEDGQGQWQVSLSRSLSLSLLTRSPQALALRPAIH